MTVRQSVEPVRSFFIRRYLALGSTGEMVGTVQLGEGGKGVKCISCVMLMHLLSGQKAGLHDILITVSKVQIIRQKVFLTNLFCPVVHCYVNFFYSSSHLKL